MDFFFFFAILAIAIVVGLPILAITAFIRAGDARRRLDGVETRLGQAETELRLLRAGLASGTAFVARPQAADGFARQPSPAPPSPAPPLPAQPYEAPAFAVQPLPPLTRSVPAVASTRPLEAIDPIEAPAAAPVPPPPPGLGGFEETIGSRWAVWVGAIALGLGGIFLVRYSIEQGLVGPGLRIALGFLFSLALLAGGEWLRRNDKGLPTLPVADIPSALTGVGAVAAFATIYAAHALYDFIGPAPTFIALGAVGLGTLVLAGVHGPLLGAIGLVAAFAAPFLVTASDPNPFVFPIYAAVITAACFALAWIRDWPWLRYVATSFAVSLGALTLFVTSGGAYPSLVQALAGLVTAALFVVPGIRFAPAREKGADVGAVGILGAFAFLGLLAVMESRQDMAAVGLFLAVALAVLALVWRAPSVAPAAPVTGLFALLVLLGWAVGVRPTTLVDPLGVPPDFPDILARIVWTGLAVALVFGIGPAFLAVWRRQREAWVVLTLAMTSIVMPLAVLAIVYGKVEGFVISPRFAALAMVLAATFGAATEAAHRLRSGRRPGLASASALYAIGALAALAFALTLLLERAWLTLALAAMIAGIAWVYTFRPLPHLRWTAALAGCAVLLRVIWDPAINGIDVGDMVILNWLLPGYGLPALSAVAAALLLRRRRGEDAPVRTLEALAMVFAALLVIVQVRHAFGAHGIRLFAAPMQFPEAATHTVTMLAFGLGLSRLAAIRTGAFWDNAVLVLRFASWAWIAVVMGFAFNPWITGGYVGPHPIVNWALLGYGLGAVLAVLAAVMERRAGRIVECRVMGLFGLAMLVNYLNITVAMLARGEVSFWNIGDGELYAYSAVWLVVGIALLAAGAAFGSRTFRLASAAMVALAVLKVFLVDMAGLTGLWRALSFIGLGLVLLVVGRVYQRVLGIAQARSGAAPPPAA
ncbi:MAG: DUF2339 domain-containing protein [Phreatobacter sp.]|uniref:DUF2339 domain-containing protein n=1 Tax=Phreatobacter sp. TaxID=1966341 RepID=UPI0027340680|nr:DUF2339 domain-containing protein [Phreatobacter sp.]MDP2802351.1 DUF2339 domain-containing protein [Phreatobacter sp.]